MSDSVNLHELGKVLVEQGFVIMNDGSSERESFISYRLVLDHETFTVRLTSWGLGYDSPSNQVRLDVTIRFLDLKTRSSHLHEIAYSGLAAINNVAEIKEELLRIRRLYGA